VPSYLRCHPDVDLRAAFKLLHTFEYCAAGTPEDTTLSLKVHFCLCSVRTLRPAYRAALS
jgi:hypothetical protein